MAAPIHGTSQVMVQAIILLLPFHPQPPFKRISMKLPPSTGLTLLALIPPAAQLIIWRTARSPRLLSPKALATPRIPQEPSLTSSPTMPTFLSSFKVNLAQPTRLALERLSAPPKPLPSSMVIIKLTPLMPPTWFVPTNRLQSLVVFARVHTPPTPQNGP